MRAHDCLRLISALSNHRPDLLRGMKVLAKRGVVTTPQLGRLFKILKTDGMPLRISVASPVASWLKNSEFFASSSFSADLPWGS